MYATTGLSPEFVTDLCKQIEDPVATEDRTWPPVLGLRKALLVTPDPASSVVIAASVSRVRRKAIPGTGKAVNSSEAICPPMMRTFWSAVIALISASDGSDSSSPYAVADK